MPADPTTGSKNKTKRKKVPGVPGLTGPSVGERIADRTIREARQTDVTPRPDTQDRARSARTRNVRRGARATGGAGRAERAAVSRAETVKGLQLRLRDAGYSLKIDGIIGPRTRAAALDFAQKSQAALRERAETSLMQGAGPFRTHDRRQAARDLGNFGFLGAEAVRTTRAGIQTEAERLQARALEELYGTRATHAAPEKGDPILADLRRVGGELFDLDFDFTRAAGGYISDQYEDLLGTLGPDHPLGPSFMPRLRGDARARAQAGGLGDLEQSGMFDPVLLTNLAKEAPELLEALGPALISIGADAAADVGAVLTGKNPTHLYRGQFIPYYEALKYNFSHQPVVIGYEDGQPIYRAKDGGETADPEQAQTSSLAKFREHPLSWAFSAPLPVAWGAGATLGLAARSGLLGAARRATGAPGELTYRTAAGQTVSRASSKNPWTRFWQEQLHRSWNAVAPNRIALGSRIDFLNPFGENARAARMKARRQRRGQRAELAADVRQFDDAIGELSGTEQIALVLRAALVRPSELSNFATTQRQAAERALEDLEAQIEKRIDDGDAPHKNDAMLRHRKRLQNEIRDHNAMIAALLRIPDELYDSVDVEPHMQRAYEAAMNLTEKAGDALERLGKLNPEGREIRKYLTARVVGGGRFQADTVAAEILDGVRRRADNWAATHPDADEADADAAVQLIEDETRRKFHGAKVRAADRDNVGVIREVDLENGTAIVAFHNKETGLRNENVVLELDQLTRVGAPQYLQGGPELSELGYDPITHPLFEAWRQSALEHLEPAQAAAVMASLEATVRSWAHAHGRTANEWFDEYMDSVTNEPPPEGALAQIRGQENPFDIPQEKIDTQKRAHDRAKADPEKYAPKNEIVRDENGIPLVGKTTFEERLRRVQIVLDEIGPEQLAEDAAFYAKIDEALMHLVDPEKFGWLGSQRQASPVRGMMDMLRVRDVKASGRELEGISVAADTILELLHGERPTSGAGAKIADFVDVGVGKKTRQIMGNDPKYGSPFVIDRWSGRIDGYADGEWIVNLGLDGNKAHRSKRARKWEEPLNEDRINDGQYEAMSINGNRFTDWLNNLDEPLLGRKDWDTGEVQAIEWAAIQRYHGYDPESVYDAIEANTRRLTFEGAQGGDAALRKIVDEETGSLLEGGIDASGRGIVRVLASPEGFTKIADRIADELGAGEVLIARPKHSSAKVQRVVLTGDKAARQRVVDYLDELGVKYVTAESGDTMQILFARRTQAGYTAAGLGKKWEGIQKSLDEIAAEVGLEPAYDKVKLEVRRAGAGGRDADRRAAADAGGAPAAGAAARGRGQDAGAGARADAGLPRPPDVTFEELSGPEGVERFKASLAQVERAWSLTEHSDAELAASRLFLNEDGTIGFLINPNGDVQNLFRLEGGVKGGGMSGVIHTVELGARTLDCYDVGLVEMYTQAGFVPISRIHYVDEYAPPGTPPEIRAKKPDIVFMAYQGGDRGTVRDRFGTFPERDKNAVPYYDKYEDAEAARDAEVQTDVLGQMADGHSEEGRVATGPYPPIPQREGPVLKGAVSFAEDGKAILHALEAADLSTYIHELAHIMRRNNLLPEEEDIVGQWAGARQRKDGSWVYDVKAEERFARGLERYVSDGEAPTMQLREAFDRMRRWMRDIYRQLRGLPEITDEMRAVFDRLFGGDLPLAPVYVPHHGQQLRPDQVPQSRSGRMKVRPPGLLKLNRGMRLLTSRWLPSPKAWRDSYIKSMAYIHAIERGRLAYHELGLPLEEDGSVRPGYYAVIDPYFQTNPGQPRVAPDEVERPAMREHMVNLLDGEVSPDDIMAGIDNGVATNRQEVIDQWVEDFGSDSIRQISRYEYNLLFGDFKPVGWFVKWVIDKPTDLWRALTLNLRPAWLVNNFVGQNLLYALNNFSPGGAQGYAKAVGLARGGRGYFPQELKAAGLYLSESAQRSEFGKLSTGFVDKISNLNAVLSDEIPRRAAFNVKSEEARSWLNAVEGTAYKAEEFSELLRLAHEDPAALPPQLRGRLERLHGDLVQEVLDELIDFGDLSTFERNAIRRVLPFYSWMKGITKATLHVGFHHPALFGLMLVAAQASEEEFSDWFGAGYEILHPYFGLSKEETETGTEATVLGTAGLNPFQAVTENIRLGRRLLLDRDVGTGIENPANAFGPMWQALIEALVGDDLFTGQEVELPDWVKLGGFPARVGMQYLRSFPQYRTFIEPFINPLDPVTSRGPRLTVPGSTFGTVPGTDAEIPVEFWRYLGLPVAKKNLDRAEALVAEQWPILRRLAYQAAKDIEQERADAEAVGRQVPPGILKLMRGKSKIEQAFELDRGAKDSPIARVEGMPTANRTDADKEELARRKLELEIAVMRKLNPEMDWDGIEERASDLQTWPEVERLRDRLNSKVFGSLERWNGIINKELEAKVVGRG